MSFFFVTFSENEKCYIILIIIKILFYMYYITILFKFKKVSYINIQIADIKNEYFCILKSSIFFLKKIKFNKCTIISDIYNYIAKEIYLIYHKVVVHLILNESG